MLLYIPFWWQCFWQMLHLVAEAGTSRAFRHAFLGHLCHLDVAARALKGAQKRKGVQQISYEHSKWSLITWERCHLRNGAENLGPALLPSKLHRELFLCMLLYILFGGSAFGRCCTWWPKLELLWAFRHAFLGHLLPLGCRRTSFEGVRKKGRVCSRFLMSTAMELDYIYIYIYSSAPLRKSFHFCFRSSMIETPLPVPYHPPGLCGSGPRLPFCRQASAVCLYCSS